MKTITIKASRRVYTVFTIMFGGLPIFLMLIGFFISGDIPKDIDIIMLSLFFIALLFTYATLSVYKISYNNNQIKYRGLLGTKTINIADIKRYKIKMEIHTISTKPIFGSFKITINNPIKPMFGLAIDTIKKKSEIIIPVNLFSSVDINNLMEHISIVNSNAKGKANAGKSVFKYISKKTKQG